MQMNISVCLAFTLGAGSLVCSNSALLCGAVGLDGYNSSAQTGGNALSASLTILSQTYCHVDTDSFSALIGFRLHLTNTADASVIVSRRIDSPDIVRVAKDLATAENGQFEFVLNGDKFVTENPKNPPFGDAPSTEDFAVLSPGQSYDVNLSVAIPGTKESSSRHGLVDRGQHILQVGISTWPYYGYGDAQALRQKWAQFGDLQLGLVYSSFVPFRIPERFKNPYCSTP